MASFGRTSWTTGKARPGAGRRARHAAWLASFGLSAEDWRRIRDQAHQVTSSRAPAALDDLSVPIRVGAVVADQAHSFSGRRMGVITTALGPVALLYWTMNEREREAWRRRLRDRSNRA